MYVCTENSLKEVLKPVAFDLLECCFILECVLAGFGVPVPPRLGNICECARDRERGRDLRTSDVFMNTGTAEP